MNITDLPTFDYIMSLYEKHGVGWWEGSFTYQSVREQELRCCPIGVMMVDKVGKDIRIDRSIVYLLKTPLAFHMGVCAGNDGLPCNIPSLGEDGIELYKQGYELGKQVREHFQSRMKEEV